MLLGCGSNEVRMRFGCGRIGFGCGSDAIRTWLRRVFGSGADGLAEVKGKWLPADETSTWILERPQMWVCPDSPWSPPLSPIASRGRFPQAAACPLPTLPFPPPPGSFCNAPGEGGLGWRGGGVRRARGVEREIPPSGTWLQTHIWGLLEILWSKKSILDWCPKMARYLHLLCVQASQEVESQCTRSTWWKQQFMASSSSFCEEFRGSNQTKENGARELLPRSFTNSSFYGVVLPELLLNDAHQM